jgi:hypothetical protein
MPGSKDLEPPPVRGAPPGSRPTPIDYPTLRRASLSSLRIAQMPGTIGRIAV